MFATSINRPSRHGSPVRGSTPPFPGIASVVLAAALAACGGGGGDGVSPPPPVDNTVASVTVTPAGPTLQVQAVVQLTATPKNASGVVVGGRTVSWSSQSPGVASVSSTGLVTGIAAGTASIVASVDGRTGSATVTVQQPAGVIATATIGPAGGFVASADVAFTVPAGALADTRQFEIRETDKVSSSFGEYAASKEYRLNGFPSDRRIPVSVRIRATSALDGVSLIAHGTMVRPSTEEALPELRYTVTPARDSSGWLVATIDVTGKPASMSGMSTSARPGARAVAADGIQDLLDGYIIGVKSADTLSTPHFQLVSYGAPRITLQPLLPTTLSYLEEAYSAIQQAGYSFAFRTKWPVSVALHPLPDHPTWYAFFNTEGPFPASPETGFMEFNSLQSGATQLWPGVAIHELFHFMQVRYGTRQSDARFDDAAWFAEATSSWIMEKAPSNVLANKNTFFYGWRDSLFTGIHTGLTASGGYGKGALVKYVADRWGDATVRNAFISFQGGTDMAQSFVSSLPEAPDIWWPAFLTAYLGNTVYALNQDELLPRTHAVNERHAGGIYNKLENVRPASARFFELHVTPATIGTGTDFHYHLVTGDSASLRLMAFQANDAGSWTSLGAAAESLTVTGAKVKEGKKIVVVALRPDATAPFSDVKSSYLVVDAGLQDGDWLAQDIRDLDDRIVYTSTQEGDMTRIDVADNVESVARLLGSAGTWTRDTPRQNGYTWKPAPGVADTLAKYGVTLSATLEPDATLQGWNYVLKSHFEMGGTAASAQRPRGEESLLWLFLPIGFLPLLRWRRTRRVGALAVTGVVAALIACDIGTITFAGKFDYTFDLPETAVTFTADAGDSSVALLTYQDVSGTFNVAEYRTEYWQYILDDQGEKVDSVRQERTGAGAATFKCDVLLYHDGKTPPAAASTAAALLRLRSSPGGVTSR